jgi:hypothetical protein
VVGHARPAILEPGTQDLKKRAYSLNINVKGLVIPQRLGISSGIPAT